MATRISNASDFEPLLVRAKTWRMLFGVEIGVISADQAAAALALSTNDFQWLRTVAYDRLKGGTHG